MMDRGCFNGPGGPHRRWVVPPTQGAFMPAGLMVRNRLENGFIDAIGAPDRGPRRAWPRTASPWPRSRPGPSIRCPAPTPASSSGSTARSPATSRRPSIRPRIPSRRERPNYAFYTLEVVQRIGYDSFTPDNGVLIAKNKDSLRGRNGGPNEFNSYIWVIDAHPEDIGVVDYVKPNGEKVMRTVADYRQLNDALFHAGLGSGSLCEWEDTPNRLHFYVVDLRKSEDRDPGLQAGRPVARRRGTAGARRVPRAPHGASEPSRSRRRARRCRSS